MVYIHDTNAIPFPFRYPKPSADHAPTPPNADVLVRPENEVHNQRQIGKMRKIGSYATQRTLEITLKDETVLYADHTTVDDAHRTTDALVVGTTAFGTSHNGIFQKQTADIAAMGADSLTISIPRNGRSDIVANAYAMDAIVRNVDDYDELIGLGYSRAAVHALLAAATSDKHYVDLQLDHLVYPDKRSAYQEIRHRLGGFAITEMRSLMEIFSESPSAIRDTLGASERSPRLILRNLLEMQELTSGVVRTAAAKLSPDQKFHVRGAKDDGMGFIEIYQNDVLSPDKFPNGEFTVYENGGHSGYFSPKRYKDRMESLRKTIEAHPN